MNIHPILDRMRDDREIYCIQPWCAQAGKLTAARLFIGLDEQPRVPACCDCAASLQSGMSEPIELWYLDDDLRARWWAVIDGAIKSSTPPPQPPEPPAPAAVSEPPQAWTPSSGLVWLIAGVASLACIIIGIVLVHNGLCMNVTDTDTGNQAGMVFGGLFLIALPFLAGVVALIIAAARSETAQKYRNWKASLSPEDRRKVEWAEVGVIWAGAAAAHHAMHNSTRARQARAAASAMGQAPYNNVHAGMQHATAILAQRQQAQRQQQPAPTLPFGGAGTPHSDIHGNVTYGRRHWP